MMSHAQQIARAWLDDDYRAELTAQGIDVPPRPSDLDDQDLDALVEDRAVVPAPASCIC